MSEAPKTSLSELADTAMRNTLMACGRAMSTGDMLEAAKSAEIMLPVLLELSAREPVAKPPDYDATLAAAEAANVADREKRLGSTMPDSPGYWRRRSVVSWQVVYLSHRNDGALTWEGASIVDDGRWGAKVEMPEVSK